MRGVLSIRRVASIRLPRHGPAVQRVLHCGFEQHVSRRRPTEGTELGRRLHQRTEARLSFPRTYGFSLAGPAAFLFLTGSFVSVDVWEPAEDGSEGDEPVIYHGRTLTSKLPLTKALIAITDFAFERSQYVPFFAPQFSPSSSLFRNRQVSFADTLGDALGNTVAENSRSSTAFGVGLAVVRSGERSDRLDGRRQPADAGNI